MHHQIKILTSKEQSSGFLDVYKYIPSYMCRHSIFQMLNCLRRGNVRTLQFKPRQNFVKTPLWKMKVNDLAGEYDTSANTISTWKKHTDKYVKEAGQISSKRKQNITSPYKDVELALLYWLKEMGSRDVPPPFTNEILRAKANRFVPFLTRFFNLA